MRSHKLCQALIACLIHYATAQTSADQVKFLYPTGGPTFNINDTVQVHYITPWATIDLTVFCFETMSSDIPENYPTYENPLPGSGLYNIEHIGNTDDLTGILGYPTLCWFLIQDDSAKTAHQAVGGNFTLTSSIGPAKTFGMGLANPTATSGSVTVTMASTTTSTRAGTTPTPYTPPSSTFSPSSSSLSTGAKAGIGASVAVLILIITALSLQLLIIRRKLKRAEDSISGLSAKVQARAHSHAMEQQWHKPELPGIGAQPVFEANGQPVEREMGVGRSVRDEEGDGRAEPDLELVSPIQENEARFPAPEGKA